MALVLIIEDNPEQAEMYELFVQMYKGEPIETEIISTGTQGLERVRKEPHPDVVMLDMHLPGISGAVIFDIIQKELPQTKVFVATGYQHIGETFREKAFRVWIKPDVSMKQVQEAIQAALAERKKALSSGSAYQPREQRPGGFVI